MRPLLFTPLVLLAACDSTPGLFEACGCLASAEACLVSPADGSLSTDDFEDLDAFHEARVAEVEVLGSCLPLPGVCPGAEYSEACSDVLLELCPDESTSMSVSNGDGSGWMVYCDAPDTDPDTEPDTDPDTDPDTEPDTDPDSEDPFVPPAPAASGTLLAFHTNATGSNEVRVYDLTTNQRVDLPEIAIPGYATLNPSLSSDGLRIAFEGVDGNGDSDIFVFDRSTDAFISLDAQFRTAGDERSPALSGDGSRVAFERNGSIHVINLTNLAEIPIGSPTTESDLSDPSLDRDGDVLAYVDASGSVGNQDIVLWSVDSGTQGSVCCNSLAQETQPSLNAFGDRVVYATNRSDGAGGFDVNVYNTSTSFRANLPASNTGSEEGQPDYGTDGSNPTIVFSSDRGGNFDLYTDDSGATRLPFSTGGDDLGASLN